LKVELTIKGKGHHEITIERFRRNIIGRGFNSIDPEDGAPGAWSKDRWKTVRIVNGEEKSDIMGIGGEEGLAIDVQARWARCQVPHVDSETGVKDRNKLSDTVVNYRRWMRGSSGSLVLEC
jgi:uncharacterized protein